MSHPDDDDLVETGRHMKVTVHDHVIVDANTGGSEAACEVTLVSRNTDVRFPPKSDI
jgi:hypothetical protein